MFFSVTVKDLEEDDFENFDSLVAREPTLLSREFFWWPTRLGAMWFRLFLTGPWMREAVTRAEGPWTVELRARTWDWPWPLWLPCAWPARVTRLLVIRAEVGVRTVLTRPLGGKWLFERLEVREAVTLICLDALLSIEVSLICFMLKFSREPELLDMIEVM